MKIRIVRCQDPQMWYSDDVGMVRDVIVEDPSDYVVRQPSGYINIVKKSDAEVIEYETN